MERISLDAPGDNPANWADAVTFRGFDSGALMLGTPGFANRAGSSATTLIFQRSSSSYASSEASQTGVVIPPVQTGGTVGLPSGSGAAADSGNILPSLRISEILPNPIGADTDEWIEFMNAGSGDILLDGWIIAVGSRRYVFPSSGFVLQSGAYLSLRKSLTGLSLANDGAEVRLLSGTILADAFSYPFVPEHVSYGRFGSGGASRPLCNPTEGYTNEPGPARTSIAVQSQNGVQTASGVFIGTGSLTLNLQIISSVRLRVQHANGISETVL